jgi:two-component system response regulator VanR
MKKILVVDDDEIVRKNLATLLGRAGFEADQAGDGVEAVEKLNQQKFELVLSDIVMPRMDGHALIAHIGSHWPKTRIIMMTAYFQSESDKKFIAAGADDFIGKPIIFDELLAKIERALNSGAGTHPDK